MNTTRILSTLTVAAAMLGGIGYAYAQTTSDAASAPAATDSTQSQMATPGTNSTGTSSSMPANGSDSGATNTEPAPKADRG